MKEINKKILILWCINHHLVNKFTLNFTLKIYFENDMYTGVNPLVWYNSVAFALAITESEFNNKQPKKSCHMLLWHWCYLACTLSHLLRKWILVV